MELVTKIRDAASMLWAALDQRERMIVVYVGASILFAVIDRAKPSRHHELDTKPSRLELDTLRRRVDHLEGFLAGRESSAT